MNDLCKNEQNTESKQQKKSYFLSKIVHTKTGFKGTNALNHALVLQYYH
jgi:hypothetical protein